LGGPGLLLLRFAVPGPAGSDQSAQHLANEEVSVADAELEKPGPGIQAIDPGKNAVNGTATNPLIVQFQMSMEAQSGRQERTILWLELVGQNIAGSEDSLVSAPTHHPGSYASTLGSVVPRTPVRGTTATWAREWREGFRLRCSDVGWIS